MKKGNWKFFGLAILLALGAAGCEYATEERPVVTTPGQVLPIGGEGEGTGGYEGVATKFEEGKPAAVCSVLPSKPTVAPGESFKIIYQSSNASSGTVIFGDQTFTVSTPALELVAVTAPSAAGSYNVTGQATGADGVSASCTSPSPSVAVVAPETLPPAPPQDTTPPSVIATIPSGSATGVAVTSTVTATFSKSLDPTSVSPGTFRLKDNNGVDVPGTVTFDSGAAIFKPLSSLAYMTPYTATISGVKDLAGNPMASDHTLSFTTQLKLLIVGPIKVLPASQPVDGLVLKFMTGKFKDMKMDDEQIRFDLCPTSDFENDPKCFRAKFGDGGFLELNNGKYESIDFTNLPDGSVKVLSERKVADLKYPDDFKYFRLAPDCDSAISPGWDSCDGWFLAGVELLVRPQGGNFKSVYRNPCVNRWIDESEDGDWSNESPHSLDDDAYCFYVETCTDDDADTESSVKIEIPVNQPLETSMTSWLTESYAGEGAKIENVKDGALPFGLNWNWFSIGEFDDFERSNFTQSSSPYNHYSQTTSYGATVYDGRNRLKDEYRVKITGDDAWHLCKIKVYHIRPGDRAFLDNLACKMDGSSPDVWISTQLSDSHVESQYWPYRIVDDVDYMTLKSGTCSGFDTIEWGKGADGFGKY